MTITQVGLEVAIAVRIALSSTSGNCSGAVTVWTYCPQASLNSVWRSTSCRYPLPSAVDMICPTIATTGLRSSLASYSPFSRWIAPGPWVARQTPTSPVYLAWPLAMKAAISSCRTVTSSGSPPARFSAARSGSIPSPA